MKTKAANPTKLTLRLDKAVIERGKTYARRNGTSLSKLVENYILEMTEPVYEPVRVIEVPDHIRALMHPSPSRPDSSYEDYREEYYEWIANKHLINEEE